MVSLAVPKNGHAVPRGGQELLGIQGLEPNMLSFQSSLYVFAETYSEGGGGAMRDGSDG